MKIINFKAIAASKAKILLFGGIAITLFLPISCPEKVVELPDKIPETSEKVVGLPESFPKSSKQYYLYEDMQHYPFDGEYPEGWPKGITLPNGSYLAGKAMISDSVDLFEPERRKYFTHRFSFPGICKDDYITIAEHFKDQMESSNFEIKEELTQHVITLDALFKATNGETTHFLVRIRDDDVIYPWVTFSISSSVSKGYYEQMN